MYDERYYQSYIEKARQFILGVRDADIFSNYLFCMQQRFNFFHLIDIDEESCLIKLYK